ncbi:hypothetical protein CTI12_AA195650 [Artemisia annua]|uniref:Uncharacterized protein n=1 Tax=Artemisia annua TaxID=35608 RepID=A0A2U1P489_ARTAN|nr:hypothetical protein CTI12_AA195650 [Artemisia annua]
MWLCMRYYAVGATLGAIAGAVIGWSNEMKFVQYVIRGAVAGTAMSYKLTKATFDYLNSDDDYELGFAIDQVMIIMGQLKIILGGDEHKIMRFMNIALNRMNIELLSGRVFSLRLAYHLTGHRPDLFVYEINVTCPAFNSSLMYLLFVLTDTCMNGPGKILTNDLAQIA